MPMTPSTPKAACESPEECVIRELAEETGLRVTAPRLRAVVTQDEPSARWMLFMFVIERAAGTVRDDCPEGRLFWCPTADLIGGRVRTPSADRVFTPWLFESGGGVASARFWHRDDLSVARFERYR